jgi:hypothetical protein
MLIEIYFGKSITFAVAIKIVSGCGAVGSASGLGPEGRQFESGHPDKFLAKNLYSNFL